MPLTMDAGDALIEPLGRFLALSPQACALGPAHLIHCLIQMVVCEHVRLWEGRGNGSENR